MKGVSYSQFVIVLYALSGLIASALLAADDDFTSPPKSLQKHRSSLQPVVGLRPFRSKGIRIEVEGIRNAKIVHNYGHGGAGLTLSWGTVEESLTLVDTELKSAKKITVVGGGVIGLTTAYELLLRGFDVTVFAESFYPNNVSNIAGGLWSPVSVDLDLSEDSESKKAARIQLSSFSRYKKFSENPEWGVNSMPLFITEEARTKSGLELFERFPDIFKVDRYERLPIDGVKQGGYGVTTFLIDTPVFMSRLMSEVTRLGGTLINRKFSTLAEIADSVGSGGVAFNCTGLGAKNLAKDQFVIPVRGDLVLLPKSPHFDPSKIEFMAFYGPDGTDYMFAHRGKMVIGGTFLEGDESLEVRPDTCAEKVASYERFFGGN